MLTHLFIQNLAVVEQLELKFYPGMTVLTGETGAGKSILLDALGLILGARADSSIVRSGSPQAEVIATYELLGLQAVLQWLKDAGLDSDEECIVRRTVTFDGKSRAYVNGHTVPLSQVRELGEKLINIHGQHAHQSLMKPEHQRELLDEYANHPELCEQVRLDYTLMQKSRKEYHALSELQGQQDRLALLQYQIQEINELNLQTGELRLLDLEHKELANAEAWRTITENALQKLSSESDQDVSTILYQTLHQLQSLKTHTPKLNACGDLLQSALVQLEEAIGELQHFTDSLESDPTRLATIDDRLSQIHTLARKHRIQPEALLEHQETLLKEATTLLDLQGSLEALREKVKATEAAYQHSAQALSLSRRNAARLLEQLIVSRIQSLEMPNARFTIAVGQKPDTIFSLQGADEIEFLVSTNPGLDLQPLRKIASGGELSRISLAIQVITSQKMTTPTLIFDEVDAGISGKTAETVGKLLKTLGEETQTLCVTHLPQIAALGHHHYQVLKEQTENSTTTHIRLLTGDARVVELARLLGGATLTKHALAHAKEMLETV